MSAFAHSLIPSKPLHRMAAANAAAAAAAHKHESHADPKTAAKMHRRSRSGCFTCRLRRKKCEEGKPSCKACTHLGLQCNYKRPIWWSNGEQRRQQKEMIKNAIKATQLSKKSQATASTSVTTPPDLCHSAPSLPTTSEIYSDSFPHTRQGSVDSPFPQIADFNQFPGDGFFQMPAHPHQMAPHQQYSFSPYEVDIKTERSVFVNDIQMRKDSTISTFSTFQQPQAFGVPTVPSNDNWVKQEYHESFNETFSEEPLDFNFFDFQHGQMSPNHEAVIEVDDCDKHLLNHFLDKVVKRIFPVLEANQHGSVRTDLILPALESNKAFLHCCLSVAATDMKATQALTEGPIIEDIIRHRFAAINELCNALSTEHTDHNSVLDATLGMIAFECPVGGNSAQLPDIPWHQHFQAASDIVNTMQLPQSMVDGHFTAAMAEKSAPRPPFNMTLTSWIDILGASMLGREPLYADTYRLLREHGGSAGLAELMGCDDQVMFMISEITCLEYQRVSVGLADEALFGYVTTIADAISSLEPKDADIQNCFSTTGAIRPKQLRTNLTALFALAARVYLVSLMPNHDMSSPSMQHLLTKFTWALDYIPEGMDGFDSCLAWPLLVAGSHATKDSFFRAKVADRCSKLGNAAQFGSLGRVRELLSDVWATNEATLAQGGTKGVHWRDVMQSKGWDFLLI